LPWNAAAQHVACDPPSCYFLSGSAGTVRTGRVRCAGLPPAHRITCSLRESKGRLEDKETVIRAMRAKRFKSVRGDFTWQSNNGKSGTDHDFLYHRESCAA